MRILSILFLCTAFFSFSVYAETLPYSERPDVKAFIKQMVTQYHFKKAELISLFDSVKERPHVMKSIRAPLEQRPWHTYQMLFITEWRIRKGAEFWHDHADVLAKVEEEYGVPASVIVSTIGIETKYGANTGEYPVIDALTNIAFSDSPRANYFRSELKEFLLLTREQHLDPRKVMGSYAGAIGQPQFMPSSYRRYAVSYDGHSKIDLSHNENDIIASIANYYKKFGWSTDQPVAVPASIVSSKYKIYMGRRDEIKIVNRSSLAEYGLLNKSRIPKDMKYNVLTLRNYWGKEYWYTFHNFDVIKRYNSSDLYAMAVFQLSHYITNLKELTHDNA
jgi:membrane-bound lytic murein transglycosylase B